MEEIWKDVVGYENFYQVSNLGRVRGENRIVKHSGTFVRIQYGKVLKQNVNRRDGYIYIGLHKNGESHLYKVHRLVAIAFTDNPQNKPEVNHLDKNKQNNNVENLVWATRIENENWATKRSRCREHTDYKAIAKKNSKSVYQISTTGEILKTWGSLAEIHNVLGYSIGNISMCCNGKYLNPLHGCYWAYEVVT